MKREPTGILEGRTFENPTFDSWKEEFSLCQMAQSFLDRGHLLVPLTEQLTYQPGHRIYSASPHARTVRRWVDKYGSGLCLGIVKRTPDGLELWGYWSPPWLNAVKQTVKRNTSNVVPFKRKHCPAPAVGGPGPGPKAA